MYLDLNPATVDLMESLSEIPTTETEKPEQESGCLLKLISPPKLLHSLSVTIDNGCRHIAVTSDRIWVSYDYCNTLILTNKTGVILNRIENVINNNLLLGNGSHTVNSENELIYIDGGL